MFKSYFIDTYLDFVNARSEGFVREEEKRAAEEDAGVIPGLQGGDQDRLAADGVRVLLHLFAYI